MSSEEKDSPMFGHTFHVLESSPHASDVEKGKISSYEDIKDTENDHPDSIKELMGEAWRTLKIVDSSSGTPYNALLTAPDKLSQDLDYNVKKVSEKVFVSPESQVHDKMMQQKQNAQQRVRQTKANLSELLKQKHMLEHDIRKLRSRVEDIQEDNETRIKADFVELVDGAGASGGGGGGDRAALKFLRDQNIYPSIVADFNEMESLDDLKSEEEGGTGKLAHLPENVKAILKKKYAMYEKWKDLYGSEIQRKLNELKGELKGIERAIEETEEFLEPYVRDMEMINQKSQDELVADMQRHVQIRGHSSLYRQFEYICWRPLKNTGEDIVGVDDEGEATHYRIVFIYAVHGNITGGDNPNDPNQGTAVAKIFWYPAIVDKFVFENIFKKKVDEAGDEFKKKIREYTGEFESKHGDKLAEARQKKKMSVRELREKMEEELDRSLPLEVSSRIRRVEDGLDDLDTVFSSFEDGEEIIKAIDEILDTSFHEESEEKQEFVTGIKKNLKLFTGQTDEYYLGGLVGTADDDLHHELTKRYYYDFKIGFGMYTMN